MTEQEKRFHAKYVVHPGGCWLWTAAKDSGGYGRMNWNGRIDGSNRISWMIHRGPIPPGIYVCHHCDVKSCVNPDHLFLGTCKENMMDHKAKGGKIGSPGLRGEKNPRAKLTYADVHQIRVRLSRGEMQSSIAEDFKVGNLAISRIATGRTWASA